MLCYIAALDMASGHFHDARTALEQALALALNSVDRSAQYIALNELANLHLAQSQWPAAHRHYEEALALAQAVGDRRWQGGLHGNLGVIERLLGRPGNAMAHFTSAATMARELGDRQWGGTLAATSDCCCTRPEITSQRVSNWTQHWGCRGKWAIDDWRRRRYVTFGLVTGALGDLDAALGFHTSRSLRHMRSATPSSKASSAATEPCCAPIWDVRTRRTRR